MKNLIIAMLFILQGFVCQAKKHAVYEMNQGIDGMSVSLHLHEDGRYALMGYVYAGCSIFAFPFSTGKYSDNKQGFQLVDQALNYSSSVSKKGKRLVFQNGFQVFKNKTFSYRDGNIDSHAFEIKRDVRKEYGEIINNCNNDSLKKTIPRQYISDRYGLIFNEPAYRFTLDLDEGFRYTFKLNDHILFEGKWSVCGNHLRLEDETFKKLFLLERTTDFVLTTTYVPMFSGNSTFSVRDQKAYEH